MTFWIFILFALEWVRVADANVLQCISGGGEHKSGFCFPPSRRSCHMKMTASVGYQGSNRLFWLTISPWFEQEGRKEGRKRRLMRKASESCPTAAKRIFRCSRPSKLRGAVWQARIDESGLNLTCFGPLCVRRSDGLDRPSSSRISLCRRPERRSHGLANAMDWGF